MLDLSSYDEILIQALLPLVVTRKVGLNFREDGHWYVQLFENIFKNLHPAQVKKATYGY